MAATNEPQFRNLLGRIGLNTGTTDAVIMGQGINQMETFTSLINEDQMKKLSKILSYGPKGDLPIRPDPVPPMVAGGDVGAHALLEAAYDASIAAYRAELAIQQVHLSAVSSVKVHAVWYWGVLRKRCGRSLSSSAMVLTNAEIDKTIARIRFERRAQESTDGGDPKKPYVLKKMEKFNEWHDAFNTYMYSIRGAARIPLPYVYRGKKEVTDEMRAETYENTDIEFMTLFKLEGDYYDVDNVRVFNELMQFVLTGPGESIIKPFRRQRDGRGAMTALQDYANGSDAVELRASQAYTVLSSTVYRRQSRNFTLDDFFARLRDAYSTLSHEEVAQPVQELRKWTETMDKIQDPLLQPCKLAIKTSSSRDEEKTFENLAKKIKELAHEIYKNRPQDRNIHGLAQGGEVGSATKPIKDSDVHGGNWSNADWKRLSDDQRKRVQEIRKKNKGKKRKVSVVESDKKGDSGRDDKRSEKAGSQFGRDAHKKGKSGGSGGSESE